MLAYLSQSSACEAESSRFDLCVPDMQYSFQGNLSESEMIHSFSDRSLRSVSRCKLSGCGIICRSFGNCQQACPGLSAKTLEIPQLAVLQEDLGVLAGARIAATLACSLRMLAWGYRAQCRLANCMELLRPAPSPSERVHCKLIAWSLVWRISDLLMSFARIRNRDSQKYSPWPRSTSAVPRIFGI